MLAKFSRKSVEKDFLCIAYKVAVLKYGSDMLDLPIPLLVTDIVEILHDSVFNLFKSNSESGMVMRTIFASKTAEEQRSFFDKKIEHAQKEFGVKVLGHITFD